MATTILTADTQLQKYLVYEAFLPPYTEVQLRAVEASGKHGLMDGIAPESRVWSWWAKDAEDAIARVKRFLESPLGTKRG